MFFLFKTLKSFFLSPLFGVFILITITIFITITITITLIINFIISTTLITGAALGVLCVFGYRHLSTSPVVELGRNPVSREVHDDATVDDSYYAVQMAKLYRERDDSFGSEMIQTLAAVAAASCGTSWWSGTT